MKKNNLYLLLSFVMFFYGVKAQTTERGYLGVMPCQYADQELGFGTPLDRVMDNSPAQLAGLRRGDVVTAVNGHLLNGGCDMISYISMHHVGESVAVDYIREGKPAVVTMVLGPRIFTSTTTYVIDKVEGLTKTWKFRDDNSTVQIIDQKNAIFTKEVMGKTQTFQINLETVVLGDVKYFALKDKMALVKKMMEREINENIIAFGESSTTKMVNYVIAVNPTTELPTETVNTMEIASPLTKQTVNSNIILEVNELSVYPNPNNGIFNIAFVTSEKGEANISVLDMEGKIIYEENLKNFNGSYSGNVDISNPAAGYYIVKIKVGNKQLFRKINVYGN
jgi:membrane-associated protease RseP (regulator of RpoE activity)